MSPIELVIVLALCLVGDFTLELFFVNDVVALPVIGGDGRSGFDIVENERFHGIPGTIQGDMQTNATHSLFEVSTFNGNRYDGFAFGRAASLAGALATDEELIDLNAAGQLFTLTTDGAAPELLKPCPGSAVTAEVQQFLQVHGIDTGFAGGKPPHGFKTVGDRTLRAVHDSSGRQRMLVLAPGADIQFS